MTYTEWVKAVNGYIWDTIGLSLDDLADACTRDMFDDGLEPREAAEYILAEEF